MSSCLNFFLVPFAFLLTAKPALAVVVDRLNNGEWGDSELNPKLQEAHEALYEGFILHYKEKWISLWDIALWIDGEFLFLQGFDPEWDKGLQFKLLHDLYIPGLEKILQDTDEPLAPATGEYVTQALLKLQWIDAQVQVGNDDKETLKPRFKEAFDFLVQGIIEDVKAHLAEFFEMAEMAFPTILQNARWPGKATLYSSEIGMQIRISTGVFSDETTRVSLINSPIPLEVSFDKDSFPFLGDHSI